MPGNRESGAAWHHTTVALRSDIYQRALEQGIDISDACNKALAALTRCSTDSLSEQDHKPLVQPVIIAKDGMAPRAPVAGGKNAPRKLHPVINADDPSAPSTVVKAKKPADETQEAPPAALPGTGPVVVRDSPKETPVPAARKKSGTGKTRSTSLKKPHKSDAIRSFVTTMISRTGDTADNVGKDELYERFTRFCRDHRITPVPDRKNLTVTLKNQFALTEKADGGTPSWAGIRLK